MRARNNRVMSAPLGIGDIRSLLDIMAKLRSPDGGCPWDQEQSFETIAPYTIEEAYEVADAIQNGDMDRLKDELGDLLFQVVFYAQISHENGGFDFSAVVEGVSDKMMRRHPHVFADVDVADAEAQAKTWEDHKAKERQFRANNEGRAHSVLDDVAKALPSLLRAHKLQKRAARVGFDWIDVTDVHDKISEEINELYEAALNPEEKCPENFQGSIIEEFGDLLFALVNYGRHMGIEPETALRNANNKFERRFREVEAEIMAQGLKLKHISLSEYDAAWERAKERECNPSTATNSKKSLSLKEHT